MDRFACMRQGRAQPHVHKKDNSYTPDTNVEASQKEPRLTAGLGLMGKRRRGSTFPPGSGEAVLVPLFFLPEHVKERGVINFHRIRLPRENDCFSLYLATIFQFPVVFVTLNIFANEQNRGKRRRCSANFTLGPSVICIYIESIRFWFIIVTIRGWGRGGGGGWQAFCHLL